jgi:hypothetical protein
VTPAGAAALFAVAGAACVVKATSYALLPGVLLAFVVALWRDGHLRAPRIAARPALAAALGLLLTFGAYVIWTRVTGRAVSTQISQVSGTAHDTSVRDLLSSIWQFYLPRVPGQNQFPYGTDHLPVYDIMLKGVWGDFGWLEVLFSAPVYAVMGVITVAVGGFSLAGLVRDRLRVDWWIVAFCALVVVCLLAGLHWTQYHQVRAGAGNFFQGRYVLPLAPLAGLALVRALQWLPRPRVAPAIAASLAALLVLDLFALALMLTRFYA